MIEYSIIIRTTGKAGEKYKKLLQSVSNLSIKPKEIIVVLPEGYKLPEDRIGNERFFFCPKGMVIQRLYGLEKCRTRYALFSDDDIAFSNDFIQKLSKPVVSGEFGFSAGPLVEFFPCKGVQTLIAILTGSSIPTVFHKNRYNSILRTTGYSFNRNINANLHKIIETQSAPWTCFFADVDKFRSIHFEDELWLDRCGYSCHDDTSMFYKAWLRGIKSAIVIDAIYDHLDGKTSTRGNKEHVFYGTGFNTIVFWHRFLSEGNCVKKAWSKICINYRIISQKFYNSLNRLRNKITSEDQKAFNKGVADGWKWISSTEYKQLPSVYRR